MSDPRANSVIIGTSASSARCASSASWLCESLRLGLDRCRPRLTDQAHRLGFGLGPQARGLGLCAAIWARASAALTSPYAAASAARCRW
ncbi:MAG: hypothetical protein R2723_12060 [Microbacterium sp.]